MKRLHILLPVLMLGLILAPATPMAGKAYIWTDENGIKRFSDTPPEGVADVKEVDTEGAEPPSESDTEETRVEAEAEGRPEDQNQDQTQEAAAKDDKPKVDPEQQRQLLQGEIETLDQLADKYEADLKAAQQRLDEEMGREIDSDESRKQIEYWQERVNEAQLSLDTTNQQVSQLESKIRSIE